MAEAIAAELEAIRAQMLRFALLQLRDGAAAEDAVQEALLAALEGADGFGGRARLKTWVFGILKHKIIDAIRLRSRLAVAAADDEDDGCDELFDARGHWRADERPADWGDPEQSLENGQFWRVFDACLDHLPEHTARVFMMREFLGFETDEICRTLNIKPANCWVVLHRARMRLRLCLQEHWFGARGEISC